MQGVHDRIICMLNKFSWVNQLWQIEKALAHIIAWRDKMIGFTQASIKNQNQNHQDETIHSNPLPTKFKVSAFLAASQRLSARMSERVN